MDRPITAADSARARICGAGEGAPAARAEDPRYSHCHKEGDYGQVSDEVPQSSCGQTTPSWVHYPFTVIPGRKSPCLHLACRALLRRGLLFAVVLCVAPALRAQVFLTADGKPTRTRWSMTPWAQGPKHRIAVIRASGSTSRRHHDSTIWESLCLYSTFTSRPTTTAASTSIDSGWKSRRTAARRLT